MPSRRAEIQMSEEEQRAFLESGHTLQVASIGPRGAPHLVAMWYVMIDGLIHFTTFTKAQKILNLKRDPRITCMLEAGEAYEELRGLVVEGEAEVIDGDPDVSFRVMTANNAKYSGGSSPLARAPEEQRRATAAKRSTVRVHPKRVYSWDHRRLAGRY